MKCDIVALKKGYRGMARSIESAKLYNKYSKKDFDMLLEYYFRYIEDSQLSLNEEILQRYIEFYQKLISYNIPCEIIAYSLKPEEECYGYSLEFLGIDVVCDMAESLIEYAPQKYAKSYFNENYLCKSTQDVEKIIPLLKHAGMKWEPCYVYKVIV